MRAAFRTDPLGRLGMRQACQGVPTVSALPMTMPERAPSPMAANKDRRAGVSDSGAICSRVVPQPATAVTGSNPTEPVGRPPMRPLPGAEPHALSGRLIGESAVTRSPPPRAPVVYSKGRGDTSPPTHHPPAPNVGGLFFFEPSSHGTGKGFLFIACCLSGLRDTVL
jgi:hypothetical protein